MQGRERANRGAFRVGSVDRSAFTTDIATVVAKNPAIARPVSRRLLPFSPLEHQPDSHLPGGVQSIETTFVCGVGVGEAGSGVQELPNLSVCFHKFDLGGFSRTKIVIGIFMRMITTVDRASTSSRECVHIR